MGKTSKLADLLSEPPAKLRETLIVEYESILAARGRSISWARIAGALGHQASAVRSAWVALERLIEAGELPRPGTIQSGSPSQPPSPAPEEIIPPRRKTAGEVFREQAEAMKAAGHPEPEKPLSGIEKLKAAGIDVSHL